MAAFLTSCSGTGTEHVIDNYYLGTIDYVEKNLSLYYKLQSGDYIGVVNPTVFAIGYNENYIIVKQHPGNWSDDIINKDVTNYYIVPVKDWLHNSPDENKIGPLTYDEFLLKREELKIPNNLVFSKIFKKLE
jgi:hypothetical protein